MKKIQKANLSFAFIEEEDAFMASISESNLNRSRSSWPTAPFWYKVGCGGTIYKAASINQRFSIGQKCMVLVEENGKCHLLYDALAPNRSQMCADNRNVTELNEIDFIRKRIRKKRRDKKLPALEERLIEPALILKRDIGSALCSSATTTLKLKYLLLVKSKNGYFITRSETRHIMSFRDRPGFIEASADTDVGIMVELEYNRDNPIDNKMIIPFDRVFKSE